VIDRHLKPSMTDFIASLAEGIHSVDLAVDEEAVQEAEGRRNHMHTRQRQC
jgi:hypothetical protein